MLEITMEKVQELLNNQEFICKMRAAHTENEIAAIMSDYGISMTEEEMAKIIQQTVAWLEETGYLENGELTERGLESVSGCVDWLGWGGSVVGQGVGIAIGTICPPAGLIILGACTLSGVAAACNRKRR